MIKRSLDENYGIPNILFISLQSMLSSNLHALRLTGRHLACSQQFVRLGKDVVIKTLYHFLDISVLSYDSR